MDLFYIFRVFILTEFVEALDKACGQFINENFQTRHAQAGTSKGPDLLVRYCDMLLKKSSRNPEESDLEDVLNQVRLYASHTIYKLS